MKNSLENIARKAETRGIYTVQSEQRGVLYVYDDGEYAICTPDFIWRIRAEKLEAVVRELVGILADIKDLQDMGVKR